MTAGPAREEPPGRTERLLEKAADMLVLAASLSLLFMVGVIVVDVVLGVTMSIRVFGAYEIVGLLMAPVAFLPMAKTLLTGQHLTVDLLDQSIPAWCSRVLRLLAMAATLGFVTLLSVLAFNRARESVQLNEVTLDRGIPLVYLIAPIFVGFLALAVCAAFLLLRMSTTILPRSEH